MGDFYQNGIVTTLHNLTDRPLDELEKDLIKFSKTRAHVADPAFVILRA